MRIREVREAVDVQLELLDARHRQIGAVFSRGGGERGGDGVRLCLGGRVGFCVGVCVRISRRIRSGAGRFEGGRRLLCAGELGRRHEG
jgi:hypothetical protein